jgi:hypothetical protein
VAARKSRACGAFHTQTSSRSGWASSAKTASSSDSDADSDSARQEGIRWLQRQTVCCFAFACDRWWVTKLSGLPIPSERERADSCDWRWDRKVDGKKLRCARDTAACTMQSTRLWLHNVLVKIVDGDKLGPSYCRCSSMGGGNKGPRSSFRHAEMEVNDWVCMSNAFHTSYVMLSTLYTYPAQPSQARPKQLA